MLVTLNCDVLQEPHARSRSDSSRSSRKLRGQLEQFFTYVRVRAISCRWPTPPGRPLQTGEQPFGGRGSLAVTGRVEMWRGGSRFGIAFVRPFRVAVPHWPIR